MLINLLESMFENFKGNPVLLAVFALYGVIYIAGIVITPIRDVVGLQVVQWIFWGAVGVVLLTVVLFVLSLLFGDS